MSLQGIDGIIKSCRDIMRKDKGMNTDAQRIPQLLWMLFLKCFDDFELQKEILGDYKPIIEKPYRWRDWTDSEKGRRGDELIEFVNNDLFKYLSSLHGEGAGDQRDVVADVFSEQKNFMTDGYGMKDMIQQVNKLDFTSSEQFHLIGTVYERMLSQMRDDSPGTFGEFYTPRPIIKFMVNVMKPSLKNRETILDPACGTGGFLIESYNHLEKQVKGTKENEFLQKDCLSGIEPRPEPYLFSMMNMMLHGIEEPDIARANTLDTKLSDIQENLQHDIILTNPPFGGEENENIKKKLPVGFQTKDTALAFILHCIKRLKDNGRCAIILPHFPLYVDTGVGLKTRKLLVETCNLHTVIRLPRTVFAPYVNIETNILFFEKGLPTKEIWYYKMPIRKDVSSYSKTNPIQFEDFTDIIKWLNDKKENENAWKVDINKIKNFDLDLTHPDDEKKSVLTYYELFALIKKNETQMRNSLKIIEQTATKSFDKNSVFSVKSAKKWDKIPLEKLVLESKNGCSGKPNENEEGVKRLGIETVTKSIDGNIKTEYCKFFKATKDDIRLYEVKKNDLFICRQNANKHFVGKFAVFTDDDTEPLIFSDSLIRFRVDEKQVLPEFIVAFMNSSYARRQIDKFCRTSAGNFSANGTNLKKTIISVPKIEIQKEIMKKMKIRQESIITLHKEIRELRDLRAKNSKNYKLLQDSILQQAFS